MRIIKRIVFEIFAVAVAGACINGLAAQQAGTAQTPTKSNAGAPPAQKQGLQGQEAIKKGGSTQAPAQRATPLAPAEQHGPEGQAASTPQAAANAFLLFGQDVGRVIRFAPDGITQHPGVPGGGFLRLGALVEEGEQIETLLTGRAQIELFDGPILNLGPLSALTITSVGAPNQPIRLELPTGSMSVESAGPARQGSRFQVKTVSAVIDGDGSLLAYDPPRFTDVCALDGTATVRNVNPSVRGEVTLHSGECTRVAVKRAPTPAAKAPKTIRLESRFTYVADLPSENSIFKPRKP